MNKPLSDRLHREIAAYAKKHGIQKVILFGSRATDAAGARSDVDLAVYGGDFIVFSDDLKKNAHTLLTFDLVNCSENLSEDLKKEIERDGILLYEKA